MKRMSAIVFSTTLMWLVLAGIASAGGGGGCYGPVSKAKTATVEMKDFCFTPSIALVEKGETVTFANRDKFKHYISGMNGTWGTKQLGRNAAAKVSFEKDGVYPYYCPLHYSMQGVVIVGDGRGPGPATELGVEIGEYVRPEKPDPLPSPEPLIFHVPTTVEAAPEPSVLGDAVLVWGGAGAGLAGGLLLHWASRRRSREP